MSVTDTMARIGLTVRGKLAPFTDQARTTWRQRSAREQKLLRWGAIVLVAALVWLVGVKPALEVVNRAQQQLPLLQAQSSRLDAILLEAQALDRGRSGKLSAAETELALRDSLVSSGLEGPSQFEARSDAVATWQISFINAPAGRLVEWLSGLPYVAQVRTEHVDLARSNIDGRERSGQLSGFVVLAMPAQETP